MSHCAAITRIGNAKRQQELLETGLRLCRVGGRVVYSTCSLSRRENDEVVQRVVRRLNQKRRLSGFVDVIECRSLGFEFGEATECGWHILPDQAEGWGPIYLAVLDLVQFTGQERHTSSDDDTSDDESILGTDETFDDKVPSDDIVGDEL